MTKPKVYVASPYGFSEGGRRFYSQEFLPCIGWSGFDILDPWALPRSMQEQLEVVQGMEFGSAQKAAWSRLSRLLGEANCRAIERCDLLVAGLDGPDVDSGTASEVGFAAGLGKMLEGYRSDFRLAGDNIGSVVNLQVEYFIRKQGGDISSTLDQLLNRLRLRAAQAA